MLFLEQADCFFVLGDAALLLFIEVLQFYQFLHELLLVGLFVDHSAGLR